MHTIVDELLPDRQLGELTATFAEDPVSLCLSEMRQQRVAIFSTQEGNVELGYLESDCGTADSDSTLDQHAIRCDTSQDCVSNPPASSPFATNPTSTNLTATNSPVANPPVANPPVANPPVANPPAANHPAANPSVAISQAANSPSCQPHYSQPHCMHPPGDDPLPEAPLRELYVHQSHIRKDLITHFKDPSIMEYALLFKMINERGDTEKGEGIGVLREVFTLFWGEFAISMTIGERERVPFVRHDHFVDEWEAIGRILVTAKLREVFLF